MKNNKGLFDKKRFEWLAQEKANYLRKLSIKKSVKIMEGLIGFADELRGNFFPDNPRCLKLGLRNKNKR